MTQNVSGRSGRTTIGIKSRLCVHQKGAGNGKTYGIWKSIAENIDKTLY